MAGAFDKCLDILLPGTEHEFSHRIQFCKLSFIVGIVDRTRTKSVSQRHRYIIFCQDIANIIEVIVQETFPVMHQAPFTHNTSPATDNTTQAIIGKVYILAADTRMNRKVIHSLLALLNQSVPVDFPCQVFHHAVYFFERLIDGNRADRNGAIADNPLARLVDIFSRREIHQRITAPFATPQCFFHFFVNARSSSGVSDIRIDFH